jgi:hypothetical protein
LIRFTDGVLPPQLCAAERRRPGRCGLSNDDYASVPLNAALNRSALSFLRVFHFAMAVKGRALRRALPAALRSAAPA